MKTILSLVLFFPFAAFSQDTCGLKKDRDPYTKEIKLSTGFVSVGSHKVTIEANSKEIDMFFILGTTEEGKCFDDQSKAAVMFSGSKLKTNFNNAGTMNCEGYFHIIFRNTPSTNYNLQKLMNQPIGSVIFTNGKVTTTVTLSEEQKQILQKAIRCLGTEAKTLLPASN